MRPELERVLGPSQPDTCGGRSATQPCRVGLPLAFPVAPPGSHGPQPAAPGCWLSRCDVPWTEARPDWRARVPAAAKRPTTARAWPGARCGREDRGRTWSARSAQGARSCKCELPWRATVRPRAWPNIGAVPQPLAAKPQNRFGSTPWRRPRLPPATVDDLGPALRASAVYDLRGWPAEPQTRSSLHNRLSKTYDFQAYSV